MGISENSAETETENDKRLKKKHLNDSKIFIKSLNFLRVEGFPKIKCTIRKKVIFEAFLWKGVSKAPLT